MRSTVASIVLVTVLSACAQAQNGSTPAAAPDKAPVTEIGAAERQALEQEWGFDASSPYATLVDVLNRTQSAIRQNQNADHARQARKLAVGYVAPADRLRLQYDFVLQQPEYQHKTNGTREIRWHLRRGDEVSTELREKIVERLIADLRFVPGRSTPVTNFVGVATEVLLLLGDRRALDVVLSDDNTMKHLTKRDGFAIDDPPEVFDRLAARYTGDHAEEWHKSRAALYTMMAERRRAGATLEPRDPVLDMRTYIELPSLRDEAPAPAGGTAASDEAVPAK